MPTDRIYIENTWTPSSSAVEETLRTRAFMRFMQSKKMAAVTPDQIIKSFIRHRWRELL